ncbi:LysR family transcriptional regulator [Enterovirga rhinocerotis]|uniref:DNA-binding transcriptional LysR family regulator n=1 Tax=Enterovirga rhinocerotis TaxID=1339210 RepID=A0A4R7BXY7_9HYPH|nr:LysR family transcriptional regulator [Enterovirga rhinocerotis]TDR88876.1 DNA-binding transcriptional LysR family regulator [Enterovirga rhinocerotis]
MRHMKVLQVIRDVAETGSIRRSAERLAIAPSALTRRIQDFEHELGTTLFERLPQGMRPNPAGELLLRHIRDQFADLDRLRSQIADLSGIRRGHVAIACSQAFAHELVPDEIQTYRAQHPFVSFKVLVRDHAYAVDALTSFEADVAVVLQPPPAPELHLLQTITQPLCALMGPHHPLAGRPTVRLRDCLQYPIAMPGPGLAIRHLVQGAIVRASMPVRIAVESDSFEVLRSYAAREDVVSFQIRTGIPRGRLDLVASEVDRRDLPLAQVALGQLRGRRLSVAASKFVEQIGRSLNSDGEALSNASREG